MPGISEMDAYGMLRDDWGSAYLITRTPGAVNPYSARRKDDPAVILEAESPGALRALVRANYLANPVPRGATP
ncbi:MAG: hypothetical protein JOY82_08835 [Streptosporangiaceae bacterium]|nr:hypothetical protein [Streptosporangiaceae bacterium]MBV9854619.1 hypothetical protein [Streptosporangiaceae bacterium]